MPKISRTQDLGTGQCRAGHPGVPRGVPKDFTVQFISGANTVFLNNRPMTIIGSLGETDCGHTTTAVSGSGTVFAENMAVHRLNDVGIINEGPGEYVSITASDNADAGG
jgi:hypothetical protein